MPDERQDTAGPQSSPAATRSRLTQGIRALRHRNFQLFFSGQMISLIGTWMQNVAQSWLVYRLTGSSLLLGAVSFSNQIPVFLMAPLGGIVADRYKRQHVVIATQTVSMVLAFILAGLTLTGVVQIWHIFVLSALLGVVNAFDIPARQAFIVEMVAKEDMINAIALNSSMFNGARVVGPAIAGLLVASIGEGWCFFANAVSYIAVIIGLILMRVEDRPPVARQESMLENVLEGFRWVKQTTPIRALLLLLGVVSFVGMPYAVLMPIFADKILHGGARGLGILMACSGVGALIGALTLAFKQGVKGLGSWVLFSSAGFGVSLILFALSRWFWISALLLLPLGYTIMVQMASSNTLIQSMVPDRLRGRVMSVYSMMFMGMAPMGALGAGIVAEHLGAPAGVAVGGVLCIIGSVIFGFHLPALRVEARRLIVAQGLIGGDPPQEVNTQEVSEPV